MKKLDDFDEVPKVLCKYRKWNKFTKDILRKHQLYFSDPNDFNDPYDCLPKVAETVFNISPNSCINFPNKNGSNIELPILSGSFKMNFNYQEQIVEAYWSTYRICSFTEIADNILMWSHYAEFHKGICLIFDTTKDTTCFSRGYKIHYSKKRPEDGLGQGKQLDNPLRTKFRDWRYEREYRIIKSQKEYYANKRSQLFDFKPEALTEIIFGAKFPEEQYLKVIRMCARYGLRHVKFSKIRLAKTKLYKLTKVPIED